MEKSTATKATDIADKNIWLALLVLSTIVFVILFVVVLFLRKRIVISIALIKEGSK